MAQIEYIEPEIESRASYFLRLVEKQFVARIQKHGIALAAEETLEAMAINAAEMTSIAFDSLEDRGWLKEAPEDIPIEDEPRPPKKLTFDD